jgi:hypothetical protein
MSAQKVVRRMRKKSKFHGRGFWLSVVLAEKKGSLELTEQSALLITLL